MTLEDMLVELKERWGFVDLMSLSSGKWLCSDSTDEGIGPCNYSITGRTPREAIEKAYMAQYIKA